MSDNKMFKQMTMYVEACESGSMFENILEDNMNVYAVSAANARESSWASYCSPNDKVNGESVGSCLGDLFSTNWMENSDIAKMNTESLQTQFDLVKKETVKSHTLQWGDLSFVKESIGFFQSGTEDYKKHGFWHDIKNWGLKKIVEKFGAMEELGERKAEHSVDSRDVKMHYLYSKVMTNSSAENNAALQAEITHRMEIDTFFKDLYPQHFDSVPVLPTDFDCYRKLIDTYQEHCGEVSDYTMKYFKLFVSECEGMKSVPDALDASVQKLEGACKPVEKEDLLQ